MNICGKVGRHLERKRSAQTAHGVREGCGAEKAFSAHSTKWVSAGVALPTAQNDLPQRACSGCAGEYEDPERTAATAEEQWEELEDKDEE